MYLLFLAGEVNWKVMSDESITECTPCSEVKPSSIRTQFKLYNGLMAQNSGPCILLSIGINIQYMYTYAGKDRVYS